MMRYIHGSYYMKVEHNEWLLHLNLTPLSLRRELNYVIFPCIFYTDFTMRMSINLCILFILTSDITVALQNFQALSDLCLWKNNLDEVVFIEYIICGVIYHFVNNVKSPMLYISYEIAMNVHHALDTISECVLNAKQCEKMTLGLSASFIIVVMNCYMSLFSEKNNFIGGGWPVIDQVKYIFLNLHF